MSTLVKINDTLQKQPPDKLAKQIKNILEITIEPYDVKNVLSTAEQALKNECYALTKLYNTEHVIPPQPKEEKS